MVRAVIDWSLKFRLLIAVVATVLLFFGISRLREMPIDVLPEFGPVVVEVQSEALGLSAQEVAEFVTVPLEADLLSNIPWVDVLRSKSVPGLSSIELIFEPGTDLLRARQVVQERLSEAVVALPGASKPPQMLQPRSSTTRVMMIGLSSARMSLIEMSVLARWNIRPRLMGVPGVSNVAIWGQREQQLQVLADPKKLQFSRVPLLQVIETAANALWASPLSFVEAAVPGTGGFIDTPNQRIGVQHISPITTPADLSQVTLGERPDLRLADLATIVEGHQPLIGDAILKSGPGLLLVIEKWPGSSTLEVTRGVEEALAAMAPGLEGIKIDSSVYRPANYIEEAIDNLTIILLVSGILAILVIVGFLFDWRMALVAAVTIPMSLIAAVLVLNLLGETMNLLVLGGLVAALVLMIDDAVSRAYKLRRRLSRSGSTEKWPTTLVREALTEAYGPLALTTIITLLGLLPLFFLNGAAGAFLPPGVLAYGAALVVSTVMAITLTPALTQILHRAAPRQRRQAHFIRTLRQGYERLLSRVLVNPVTGLVVAGLLLVVGLGVLTQLTQPSLLSHLNDRNLLLSWSSAPGSSHTEMTRILSRAVNEIAAIPGVTNVGSHVGRAINSDQVVGINSAEIWVTIAPDANYEATSAAIQWTANAYAGSAGTLSSYPEKRVSRVLTGSTKDVVVRVYGEETGLLREEAEAVKSAMASVRGIVDLEVENAEVEPTIEIKVDLAAAQRLGIKPGDVRRYATTLVSGLQVGSLFEEQKVFEVVVWSTPETRNSINSIRDLMIDTPSGAFVRLGDVADVRIVANPAVVKRESVSRYLDVTANVGGRGLRSVEDEIRTRLKEIRFPIEYHAEVVTDKAGGVRTLRSSIVPYVVASAIGVFLLLQAAFGSWRLAALAFFILPTALAGGVIAAGIAGYNLSIGSYLGFLAVLGLSVRNGIELIGRYVAQEQANTKSFGADLVVSVAGDRVVPIVMTALAVAAALLPILLAGGRAGLEVIQPLAIVVLGGLVTSTLLHLFILPALYLFFWSPAGRDPEEFAPSAMFTSEPQT
jgi:CzcA family heavy metal efflux pump